MGFFPSVRADVKAVFEALKEGPTPDLIFTHEEADLHQDHNLLGSLTRETFRDHMVLGYEIPKFDGGLGSPNVFSPLDAATVDRKIDLALRHFPTQTRKALVRSGDACWLDATCGEWNRLHRPDTPRDSTAGSCGWSCELDSFMSLAFGRHSLAPFEAV